VWVRIVKIKNINEDDVIWEGLEGRKVEERRHRALLFKSSPFFPPRRRRRRVPSHTTTLPPTADDERASNTMDGGNSTVFNLPTQREVSESCYEYLLAELLAHAAPTAAPSSSSSPSSSGEAVPSNEQTEGGVQFQLESLGYDVGYRYCEKLVANQRFASTETLDTVKFLCKEFWEEVFKKKV
jgi:hypothetical protein